MWLALLGIAHLCQLAAGAILLDAISITPTSIDTSRGAVQLACSFLLRLNATEDLIDACTIEVGDGVMVAVGPTTPNPTGLHGALFVYAAPSGQASEQSHASERGCLCYPLLGYLICFSRP